MTDLPLENRVIYGFDYYLPLLMREKKIFEFGSGRGT